MQALRQQAIREARSCEGADLSQRLGGAAGVGKSRGWAVRALTVWVAGALGRKKTQLSPDSAHARQWIGSFAGTNHVTRASRRVFCTHVYVRLVLCAHAALIGDGRL